MIGDKSLPKYVKKQMRKCAFWEAFERVSCVMGFGKGTNGERTVMIRMIMIRNCIQDSRTAKEIQEFRDIVKPIRGIQKMNGRCKKRASKMNFTGQKFRSEK